MIDQQVFDKYKSLLMTMVHWYLL